MFGCMLSALAGAKQAKAMADTARAHFERNERLARNLELMGRTFKCGPWRWRIDPKHADVHGRPLSSEIKITWIWG